MSKLGLRLPDSAYGYSLADVIRTATLAEDCGYHSVWYPEGNGRDVFVVLGHLATHTDSIRLASGITPVFARVPTQLAMGVGTLDELSDGRAMVGLGASSKITVEQWHGVEFERPLRRIRETIEILDLAMANDRVDYDGDLFHIDDYPRKFEPVQSHVPVFNAALGQSNRRLTGEFADGWLPVNVPFHKFEAFLSDVHDGARKRDRDPDDITIAPYVFTAVSEDRERARDAVRAGLAYYAGAMDYYGKVFTDWGYGDDVDRCREAWQDGDYDAAADALSDEFVDDLAIAGTPEEGRERIAEYRDLGVDMPVLYPPKTDEDLIEGTIEALAPN